MTSVVNAFKPALGLVFLFFGLLLTGCSERAAEPVRLQGLVFGTGWSLVYLPTPDGVSSTEVKAAVESAFDIVNASMNTYDPSSTISRFNALSAGEAMEADWDFTYVFNEARKISELSEGAYDVTISPLLAIWGFGPSGPDRIPDGAEVDAAFARVGLDKLEWDSATRTLRKLQPGVSLDFSSIAKGYGVDIAADALDELGIKHFMLEVGGELQLRGNSPRGEPWRIAIERPTDDGGIQAAVDVSNVGVATSGDYRNFFEVDGVRYSHLIDPTTGAPIRHELVSATVIHPSTALADAWATAVIVMGEERALEVAEAHNLAVYLIRRKGGQLTVSSSPAFAPYLVK